MTAPHGNPQLHRRRGKLEDLHPCTRYSFPQTPPPTSEFASCRYGVPNELAAKADNRAPDPLTSGCGPRAMCPSSTQKRTKKEEPGSPPAPGLRSRADGVGIVCRPRPASSPTYVLPSSRARKPLNFGTSPGCGHASRPKLQGSRPGGAAPPTLREKVNSSVIAEHAIKRCKTQKKGICGYLADRAVEGDELLHQL